MQNRPPSHSVLKKPIELAYVLQNPALPLDETTAASTQFIQTYRGLITAGHQMTLLSLRSLREVVCLKQGQESQPVLGFSKSKAFTLPEGLIRWTQGKLSLPYLALFDSLRFYDACRKTIEHCTLIHERSSLFAFGAAVASRRMNKPYVLFVDADPIFELDYLGKPLGRLERWFAARTARFTYHTAAVLICVSEVAKRMLTQTWQISPEKVEVLPNAADTDCFRPNLDSRQERERLRLDGGPVILFSGSFWPWHGVDQLVSAFARVLKTIPQARLVLVGDGPTRPAIEKQVGEHGLSETIRFLGKIDYRDMPQALALGDILAAPYPTEPALGQWQSPMKLYEYMAAGKAIVASRVGQIPEVLQDGENGILTRAGDADDLARALQWLIEHPQERDRLGNNARRSAVDHHSWEQYIHKLEAIYWRVLDTRNA
jgi:glycosyltransferase involved in cell wall biosynthesis